MHDIGCGAHPPNKGLLMNDYDHCCNNNNSNNSNNTIILSSLTHKPNSVVSVGIDDFEYASDHDAPFRLYLIKLFLSMLINLFLFFVLCFY